MPHLALFVLGPPHIEYNGRPVAPERHKSLALLAYLAVSGQRHRRDTLACLLWPELGQQRARGGLRGALSTLRTSLPGDWWDIERETISLQPSPGLWVDLHQFRRLLAACRTHRHPADAVCSECIAPLVEAAQLIRGDFLAGFSLRDAPNFDEWELDQADELRRDLASVLERLAQAHSGRGDFGHALEYARRRLSLDSLQEAAHQHLMQLYTWAGQRPAALRQYAECLRVLDAELGIAPQPATVQLYQAIKDDRLPLPDGGLSGRSASAVAAGARAVTARPDDSPLTAQSGRRGRGSTVAVPGTKLDRIVRGHIVGREHELAQAGALWARARAGELQVLLLSGEPGVGKSRLVHELARLARAESARVLAGESYPEGGPPYAPLADIIGQAVDAPQAARSVPEHVLADLLLLAPHLQPRFSDIRPNPALGADFERQRLYDSFVMWCESLGEPAPALLLVEDVHWADSGTLALLHQFIRRGRRARVLLVLTYRDTEVDLGEARGLNQMLLDLNRERLAENLALARLSREQTGDLLAGLLAAGEVSAEFRDTVFRETEGNPFFVEEVCKGLIEAGELYYTDSWRRRDMAEMVIPRSIRAAITARLERLPAAAQEALRLAAVLGREFDFDTLSAASDQDEETLISALEQAGRTQVLTEARRSGRVRYTFAHALIPFTLRASLSALRLQRLHARVALTLEGLRRDDFHALAYHFAAGGVPEKAIGYSSQAAAQAVALYAYEEGIQHLRTALDLMGGGAPGTTRLAMLEQLGDLYCLNGERAEAMQSFQAALEIARRLPDADRWAAVRLHRKIVETYLRMRSYAESDAFEAISRASVEAGLQLIAGEAPHLESARLLTTLANDVYWKTVFQDSNEQPERIVSRSWDVAFWRSLLAEEADVSDRDLAQHYARSAVAMAEQLDAPEELSAALDALATDYGSRGLQNERLEVALRRLALSRDARFQNPRERINIQAQAGVAFSLVGQYEPALAHSIEAEHLAGQIRDVSHLVYALSNQALCYFGLDRWDEMLAIEDRRRALEDEYGADRIDRMCFYCGLSANVLALRGEPERSRAQRERAYNHMADNWGPPEVWPTCGRY